MSSINEENANSKIVVGTQQKNILLNDEAQKNTIETTKDKPWVPDEAKKQYHNQRLGQSKWSFRLSICGNIIGIGILIWSIYQGVKTNNLEWIGVISGAVIEVVSILFFSMSNKANEKISEFFIELTKDSNVKSALQLSNEITEDYTKDQLKVKLALYLVGIDEEKICKNTDDICKKYKE